MCIVSCLPHLDPMSLLLLWHLQLTVNHSQTLAFQCHKHCCYSKLLSGTKQEYCCSQKGNHSKILCTSICVNEVDCELFFGYLGVFNA